jgi:hypothetical protein
VVHGAAEIYFEGRGWDCVSSRTDYCVCGLGYTYESDSNRSGGFYRVAFV